MKIAVITSFPSPFTYAIYQRMLVMEPTIELRAYFYGDSTHRPDWGKSPWEGIHLFGSLSEKAHALTALLDEFQPSFVLVNGYANAVVRAARKYAYRAKAKFVPALVEAPSPAPVLKRLLRRKYIQWFLSTANGLACMGPHAACEYGIVYHGPMADTPYAFDVSTLLEHPRPREGLGNGVTFLFSGRMVEYRQPLLAVQAFATIHREHPDSKLLLSGKGPLEKTVRRMVTELGLDSVVWWRNDFQNWHEILNIYREADVLLSPNLYSTWNMTIQEAMASGLGVISTWTTDAAIALISNRFNGFLIPVGNRDSLVDAMLDYAGTPQLIAEHGLRSRERMRTLDDRTVAAELLRFLRRII